MATIKFSAFSPGGTGDGATTQLVGFKVGDATANYKYSISDLATMLSPSIDNFYSADGTIGTTRIAKVTDTVTFQNVGGTSSLFSLNTNGTFTLGLGATNTSESNVSIGEGAACSSVYGIAIGKGAVSDESYSTIIGNGAVSTGGFSVGIGSYAVPGTGSIAIGHSTVAAGDFAVNIGYNADGSAANSITLNASGASVTPSTQYAFGAYMTSSAYPDFSVSSNVTKFAFDADSFATLTIADASHTTLATGESGNLTLDAGGEVIIESNLKVTGQAYSEQHDSLAGNATVDWNNGNNQYIQLASGANTFTPSNPLDGATYILQIKQPSAGAAGTVTWGATVKWPAAAAPTLTATNDAIDVVTLVYNGTTTHYYATSILNLS